MFWLLELSHRNVFDDLSRQSRDAERNMIVAEFKKFWREEYRPFYKGVILKKSQKTLQATEDVDKFHVDIQNLAHHFELCNGGTRVFIVESYENKVLSSSFCLFVCLSVCLSVY